MLPRQGEVKRHLLWGTNSGLAYPPSMKEHDRHCLSRFQATISVSGTTFMGDIALKVVKSSIEVPRLSLSC